MSQQQNDTELSESRRLHESAVAKNRRFMAITLALFGYQDRFVTALDHFLAWSSLCQLSRQAQNHEADAGRLWAEASYSFTHRAAKVILQRCPTESSLLLA